MVLACRLVVTDWRDLRVAADDRRSRTQLRCALVVLHRRCACAGARHQGILRPFRHHANAALVESLENEYDSYEDRERSSNSLFDGKDARADAMDRQVDAECQAESANQDEGKVRHGVQTVPEACRLASRALVEVRRCRTAFSTRRSAPAKALASRMSFHRTLGNGQASSVENRHGYYAGCGVPTHAYYPTPPSP